MVALPVPLTGKRRRLPDTAATAAGAPVTTPRQTAPVPRSDAPGVDRKTAVIMAFLVAVTRLLLRLARKDGRDEFNALRSIGLWDFYRVALSETQQRLYIRQLTTELEQLGYTAKHVEGELRALRLHWDSATPTTTVTVR